jgi:hypothetical protein
LRWFGEPTALRLYTQFVGKVSAWRNYSSEAGPFEGNSNATDASINGRPRGSELSGHLARFVVAKEEARHLKVEAPKFLNSTSEIDSQFNPDG